MNFLIIWEQIVSYYQDLTFDNLNVNTIQLLGFVFAFGIGGVAAIFAAYFTKRRTGAVIDPLLLHGATSPETAITAKAGGFDSPRKLSLLIRGKMLRKTVVVIGDEPEDEKSAEKPEKTDGKTKKNKAKLPSARQLELMAAAKLSSCRFYIPEERVILATRRFSGKKTSVFSLLISVVLVLAIAVGIYYLLPVILQMTDNILNMTGGAE